MGRDATVSWGGPDFAFKNDLKTGILIKTSYTDSTLTFSFYGTKPKPQGRHRDRPAVELALAGDDLRARPLRAARLRAHRQRARTRWAST